MTIIEAVIAVSILAVFGLGSTVALNLLDDRAARNRNTEAARAVVDDYINYLLDENTAIPTTETANGTDLDGDGIPDGVVCTLIGNRYIPNGANATNATGIVPLVTTRTASALPVVNGTLYWRVQAVGTDYGLRADSDLMQVNFLLAYQYRGKTYYYKAFTIKATP